MPRGTFTHPRTPLCAAALCGLLLAALVTPAAAQVREQAPTLKIPPAIPAPAQQPAEIDEQTLKKAGVASDAAGLIAFFKQRSLKEEDRRNIEQLIKQLDSTSFRTRDQASKKLIDMGSVALPYLKRALKDSPLEVVRRAEACIRKIEGGPGPELPAAAARVLALRRPPEAIPVLFEYLPHIDDEMVEEEVLTALGSLGVRGGKVDARLTAALKSQATEKRAAAAYALAQFGGLEERDAVRAMLADPAARVKDYAASGLVGKRVWQSLTEPSAADESILKDNKVTVTEAGLVEFLRKRSLSADDEARLRGLVKQLGSGAYREREIASKKLIAEGSPALSFLKEAQEDSDAETTRRAEICMDRIKRGPGPALPAAAIRQLGRHNPAAAIPALLTYLPFAEDETVEEEALTTLCLLGVRQARIDPVLLAATNDAAPARRAAAAYVLGRVGGKDEIATLPRLLKDQKLKVRFRAAQGLLAAGDRAAVPELIDVAATAPSHWCWQIEESLQRLAGGKGPTLGLADDTAEARKKAVTAWADWWRDHGTAVEIGRAGTSPAYMGLTLVCEYDNQLGQPGGRVFEAGRDGKPRWQLRGVMGPMDAEILPNGRILVVENMAQKVTERDMAGNVKWEHRVPNNPIAAQRLPNGNTFIATYNQVMEVTPNGQAVYTHGNTPGFYIFSARKLRDGRILCMNGQGIIMEMDSASGRVTKQINTGQAGGWCSVELLPNGRYLVALMGQNKVKEIDASGATQWEANYPGVFRATRLPNGNTVVVSMTNRRVAEIDRGGNVRNEIACEGRPWMARYR